MLLHREITKDSIFRVSSRLIISKSTMMEESKMAEFYDPMLYLSTPAYPNTMGALVVLKEPVDGDILRDVVGNAGELR